MSREDRSIIGLGAFAVAIAALCVALFGLRDDSSAASSEGGSSESSATVIDVELSEWAIGPTMTDIAPGPVTVRVTNTGTMVHNFSIPSLSAKTPDLQPGETYELDLGTVEAGSYDALCEIAGHAASGMTAVMVVGDGGAGTDHSGDGTAVDWQTMDRQMEDVALLYPAKTAGHGGELMEYTVAEDGAKVFEVTAMEVDWEVSPGKFVTATTYNGVVPAPEIHVEVGDLVRVNFKNNLPESTDIHFHGIRVPWTMDGVDPYTQPPVIPGGTFVYEFVAQEIQVGIYHSHHDAQTQIPNGLFGAFTVGEMPIPDYLKDKGYTKVDRRENMVLNDAGVIGLSLNGKAFPATEPYTLRKGEVMQVNYLNEGLTAHPMHLHQPMGWIIAKDGIPLEYPIPGDTINIAPGERYTVLYKAVDEGVWAWHCHILTHAESATGMLGMVTAVIVTQ
jgi:plastocyanin